ncbi:ImmA/IrrE family metallo-endopeptidase [Marinicella meishanensis]|uniref:ImmA/IrrE family metallo-endopeptidase n=1 Tax=Marinicella meishanensis TaxID=2873263 RepID=UPI001CC0C2C8|nr:ImmA/IrrE family metallo-endopeptidase [Marinicella sp. NBU2979]
MEPSATRQAENLLKEIGIDQLPVDPFLIASMYEIDVQDMPSKQGGVSGMIVKVKDNYGILYATHIENDGFQRFSICHELGHYFLPGHPEIVFSTSDMHTSKSGFVSSDKHEIEADNFATGLLMPSFLFDRELEKLPSGLDAIVQLSEICNTSITATAIRYAQRTPDPAAIVVSTGDRVSYCFMSDELTEYPELTWIKKQSLLPRETHTYEFNKDSQNIKSSAQISGTIGFNTWFGGSTEGELYEEVIGLGSYGKTLTVLTGSELPDLDELEEDKELEESWTPRFKR